MNKYAEAAEMCARRAQSLRSMISCPPIGNPEWDEDCRIEAEKNELAASVLRSLAEGKVLVPRQCDDVMYAAAMDCSDDDGNMREIVEAAIAAAIQEGTT